MITRSICIAGILFVASPALAQPAPEAAEAAYQEGRRLYDLQEWDAAIAKFKDAYKQRSDAASLFNIAQAYRLKGDCAQAATFYKTYKRNFPNEKNIAKVDKFITEMEACAAKQPAIDATKPEQTKPEVVTPVVVKPEVKPVVVEPLPPPPPPSGHGKRGLGIGLLVGGGVAAAVGAVFAVQASKKASDAANGSGVWDPSLEDAGKRDALLGKVLIGVGGAAIIGGALVLMLGGSSETAEHVSIAPHPGGASAAWSFRF